MQIPRIVIAGLSGGSGKTLASLGLVRAFVRRGFDVQPFKKGPDYIDAAWLEMAAARSCANLDPWFSAPDFLRGHLVHCCMNWGSAKRPFALIEGNRGIFDGKDAVGSCSTANLAVSLEAPVILVLNCAKMTRTAAAIVGGIKAFQPDFNLGGVILNNIGTIRQGRLIRAAIDAYTDVPVLGCLPRMPVNPLPERHMGLSLFEDKQESELVLENLGGYVEDHVDLEAILTLCTSCPELPVPETGTMPVPERTPCIGYVKDDAFWFYYRENLEALENEGAKLLQLSLLDPAAWPKIDGLYLGGGFPELYPEQLSGSPHLDTIRKMVVSGRPVYAECGGMVVLCRKIFLPEGEFALGGLLEADAYLESKPQGHGYVQVSAVQENPWHPRGLEWTGHEFHYSRLEFTGEQRFVLDLQPGTGMRDGQDGLIKGRLWGGYTHLFAPAVPHWAKAFVELAAL